MLPNPLHPAVVHFPIVFMFLLPISAGVALWAIRRGANPLKAWAVPVAFALVLAVVFSALSAAVLCALCGESSIFSLQFPPNSLS